MMSNVKIIKEMKPIRDIKIGEEIKIRFDKSGLTQKEFGSKIGMPQQNVSRVFNGESIDTKRLVAVSRALNFNFFELYTEIDHREVHTEGDYSPVSDKGDITMVVGDAVLNERIKSLEDKVKDRDQRLCEKDERIAELKERIEELKTK